MNGAGRGILFVLSAPSGTGKSTLARRLLAADSELEFSVSYTTRPRREGEIDGREYHFVGDAAFDQKLADGDFLEWANVHGRRYGTGRAATEAALERGRDVLLDIDVVGAREVRKNDAGAVLLFVMPPDYATLEARLRSRKTESTAEVERRLAVARGEAEEFRRYDYLVINDDLDRAARQVQEIVRAERLRTSRRLAEAERIVLSFPRR